MGESHGWDGEARRSRGVSANEGAAPVGRRDFGLAEEIARVERAARDWGVHVDALEGRFVGALLKAIEETGKTNLAALGDLEALFERARREGEADRRRIERMVEAGSNALAMAHQATERAGLASVRAEGAIDDAIARIAEKMSGGPLSESQKWLVSKQTERNRREASRLAAWVGAAALAGFIGGGGTMRWWSARRARPVRPCWRRSIAVGLSRGWCGWRMAKLSRCAGSRI